jgi:urease accessory protein
MSAAISPSDASGVLAPLSIRAEGRLAARFTKVGTRTALDDLRESGGYRLKFPRGVACEAVIVNTGGGVAGGDDLVFDFTCASSASATITSQAAEKLYRSDGAPVTMRVSLSVADAASLHWLPQETILFDGAILQRRFDIDLAAHANALIFESVVFGRLAMGEIVAKGALHDRWRLRIADRLVFADEMRLENDLMSLLSRPATFNGAKACATVLFIGEDAAAMRDHVRAMAWSGVEAGFSLVNGVLVGRFLAHDPVALRAASAQLLQTMRGEKLPRVFTF